LKKKRKNKKQKTDSDMKKRGILFSRKEKRIGPGFVTTNFSANEREKWKEPRATSFKKGMVGGQGSNESCSPHEGVTRGDKRGVSTLSAKKERIRASTDQHFASERVKAPAIPLTKPELLEAGRPDYHPRSERGWGAD